MTSDAPKTLRLERVLSTQDVVHELADTGVPDGMAVVAAEQTAGRGSRGRQWESSFGGLWLSVLRRPPAVAAVELLSIRVGLAVADALASVGVPDLRLKWPNDLILRDRKVGGILCEARWQGGQLGWIAVGIGINVRNRVPEDVRMAAIALHDVVPGLEADDLVDPIVSRVRRLEGASPVIVPAERALVDRYDWLRGRAIVEPADGVADGITDDGQLRVRTNDGRVVLARTGPVTLAP